MKKLLVAFNSTEEDKCQGDSSFGPESRVEFKEGMTFDQARELFFADLMKDWYPEEDPIEVEEFLKNDFGSDITGFWVIDEILHDLITNIDVEWGGDSAVYAGIRTMKSQIDKASTSELIR